MPLKKEEVSPGKFNPAPNLPFNLRTKDFELAMTDIYDFFFDVNVSLLDKSLRRFEDTARPAMLSGMISDLMSDALATHSRSLVVNRYHNGHPDLLVVDRYPDNRVQSGEFGVEIKSTQNNGGAVDTHGARNQWMCVFVYKTDRTTRVAAERDPLRFTEVYLAEVSVDDFRLNSRQSATGTRTATLDAEGLTKLRRGWIYLDKPESTRRSSRAAKRA